MRDQQDAPHPRLHRHFVTVIAGFGLLARFISRIVVAPVLLLTANQTTGNLERLHSRKEPDAD